MSMIPAGTKLFFSLMPDNLTIDDVYCYLLVDYEDSTSATIYDNGGGAEFTATKNIVKLSCSISFVLGAYMKAEGTYFEPMLCTQAMNDGNYTPYTKTNAELTADVSNISKKTVKYGTSSTGSSTTGKIVSTNNHDFVLETGARVSVKFTYANTATSPTLNVDSTGAKYINGYGSTKPALWWKAADVVDFVYDGTYFIMQPSQGQISDLNNALSKHTIGTVQKLTLANHEYTMDSDGYIRAYSPNAFMEIKVNNISVYISQQGQMQFFFVKKGMIIKTPSSFGSDASVSFYPLV